MAWFGLAAGVLGLAVGIALVVYARKFPPKKPLPHGKTGIPTPTAPSDQRRVIMGSGLFLCLSGVVVLFATLVIGSALSRG